MGRDQTMKFLDLFAGVGGFRLGMEQAGHECVGFCEIDKFARESYKAIHDTKEEVEMHDITTVSDEFIRGIGSVDVICGGFPCQAFSIAGKRKGFEDTRGTLFFEIARFASILRPRYLFLENVKGLLNHEGGATFETILRALDELGYDAEWNVFNSKLYVPQNRERVFIIGHLRGAGTRNIFPFSENGGSIISKSIQKIENVRKMGKSQSGDVVSTKGLAPTMCSTTTQKDPLKIVVPVLTPDRVEKRQNGRRFKTDGEEMFTLTSQDRHGIMIKEATTVGYAVAEPGDSVNISHPNSETRRGRVGRQIANTLLTGEEQAVVVNGLYTNDSLDHHRGQLEGLSRTLKANKHDAAVTDGFRIRKLTPLECWRLQGFPDWSFNRAAEVNSNSQLYKQAGNSVTVPVIYEIAKRLV